MLRMLFCFLFVALCIPAFAGVRIKDITSTGGVREYQLLGYGIVIGLQGTGDTLRNSPFTEQAVTSMLDRMGVNVRANSMRTRNLAAVLVTASLPPFGGWGSTLDVTVSSLGDATSLMGGTLVMTSLSGVDGNIYALAQGPIAVSGYAASGQSEKSHSWRRHRWASAEWSDDRTRAAPAARRTGADRAGASQSGFRNECSNG